MCCKVQRWSLVSRCCWRFARCSSASPSIGHVDLKEKIEACQTTGLAGRLLVEDVPLTGTGDARYFRYDVHGQRTWEIGPQESSGIRLALFEYRDSDDKPLSVKEGSIPNESSTSLTEFRRVDHGYDARRNPERETGSAAGTAHTLVQRTFDLRNRLECEARRMNPDAFVSLWPSPDFDDIYKRLAAFS